MAELTSLDWKIVKAYADYSMNSSEAARSVYMARNGFEYHLEKVKKHTGLNPKCFYDLVKLMEVKSNG